MSEQSTDTAQKAWPVPSELENGEHIVFGGKEWVVVATAPGEASLQQVDNAAHRIAVMRWAVQGKVIVEIETNLNYEEFDRLIEQTAGPKNNDD